MRMGVLFCGPAMRGPAGVSDAERAVQRILAQDLFQVGQLARSATHLKHRAGRAADGDARRIVTAVFQTPQSLNDDGNYFLFADITDDSAHARILCDEANATPATKSFPYLQRKSYAVSPFPELKSAMIAARGFDEG